MLSNSSLSGNDYEKFTDANDGYSDRIDLKLCELEGNLEQMVQPAVRASPQNSVNQPVGLPNLELPQLELPKFNGKPERYSSFMKSLEDILNKFNLTEFERYSYLRQQVSGPARQIVNSLPTDNLTFTAAKQLLYNAFSDKTTQQFSVIESLINLRLDSGNYFSWISDSRQIVDQIEKLNITSETFAQYFLWNNMPQNFQKEFTAITNESRPTLSQIIDNSFEISRRMNLSSEASMNKKVVTLATKVEFPNHEKSPMKNNAKTNCGLCISDGGDSNHKIYQCPSYPSPQSKLQKIDKLGGCTRCGLLSHTLESCHFKFSKKCGRCRKFHAYYLCIEGESKVDNYRSKSNKKSNSGTKQTNSCDVSISVLNTQKFENSSNVIPTFTARVLPKKGNRLFEYRAMYDPASESSFISERACDRLNCKIIQNNISVNISGFNGSKKINTKLVEVKMKNASSLCKFAAIVVPHIRAKLKPFSKIELIKNEFDANNIILADRYLHDKGDIDILLGVDYASVMPVQSCSFGKSDSKSLLYYCDNGVMLAGNLHDLVGNLPHLSLVADFIREFRKLF